MKILVAKLSNDHGSALVTVLIMISLLTIVTVSILGIAAWQQRFIRRDVNRMQALYLAEAGIQKALWNLANETGGGSEWRTENLAMPLFDRLSAQVSVRDWGGFVVIKSQAVFKKQTERIETLAGESLPPDFNQAVIIGGTDYPLVVTGKNQIVGDVTVGKGGVKTGWIRGEGFRGKQMVDGKIHIQTPNEMPIFNINQLEREVGRFQWLLKNPQGSEIYESLVLTPEVLDKISTEKQLFVHGDLVLSGESLESNWSFNGPEVVVASGKITFQSLTKISGKVLFISGKEIRIEGAVRFRDCIFYAQDSVVVSGPVHSAGQFISPQRIVIGPGAQLEYPSVIFCPGYFLEDRIVGTIEIKPQAQVAGTVLFYPFETGKNASIPNEGQIILAAGGEVTGVIFSANTATIEGRVTGLVVTDRFQFYLSPTTYINWLKDAGIDRKQLSNEFVLPVGFGKRPEFRVVRFSIDY